MLFPFNTSSKNRIRFIDDRYTMEGHLKRVHYSTNLGRAMDDILVVQRSWDRVVAQCKAATDLAARNNDLLQIITDKYDAQIKKTEALKQLLSKVLVLFGGHERQKLLSEIASTQEESRKRKSPSPTSFITVASPKRTKAEGCCFFLVFLIDFASF